MNKLPEGWIETMLGEVVVLVGGGTPKTSTPKYWNGNIPWLSVVDFNNDNRWVNITEKSITDEGLRNSSTKLLNKGDLIISARGTVGALAQLKERMAFNQSCYGIKEIKNISDSDFLFYLIKYSLKQIARKTHGAVFDTITRQTFDNISVNLPPLPEQKAIAAVLSAFDDKIELLREQNRTLETLAQTIFKEWFVHFNFPDQNGKPYRDNGGEMVDSELGEIPLGWEYRTIESVADRIAMGPFGSNIKVSTFVDEGIPVISGQHLHEAILTDGDNNFITPEHAEKLKNSKVLPGDIIFTHAGNIGQVSIIPDNAKYSEYVISQRQFFLRVDKEKISKWFLLMFFKSRMGQHLLLSNASQVGVPSIARPSTHLKSIMFPFPPKRLQGDFEDVLVAIINKVHFSKNEIEQISKIRDTLLPKLMSGETRVKGFEQ